MRLYQPTLCIADFLSGRLGSPRQFPHPFSLKPLPQPGFDLDLGAELQGVDD